MRSLKVAIVFLLIESLSVSAVFEALAQRELPQETGAGKVIVISEKVGETIDREERSRYRLFPGSLNFLSAIILQLPDSSYAAEITEEKEGIKQVRTLPIDQETLEKLREHINYYEKRLPIDSPFPPIVPAKPSSPSETRHLSPLEHMTIKGKVKEAKKQAKIMMKEKWTKERWREESRHDRATSYRSAGGVLGFALGATAGMLIGKGLQGRKVERTVYHPGGWNDPSWTEEFYSYKHRHAPIWGAAIGGIGGAVTGYYFGKKADKEYYILIPRNIRMMETKPSRSGCLFGFGLLGPIMGGVAGYSLYMPMSGDASEDFGWPQFACGFFAGGFLGSAVISSYNRRAKYKRLWEESLLEEKLESSLDIQIMPLDPTTFALRPRRLPSGEIIYEYHVDMLRVHF